MAKPDPEDFEQQVEELIALLSIMREELGTQITKLRDARNVRRYRATTGRVEQIHEQQRALIREALQESKALAELVKQAS